MRLVILLFILTSCNSVFSQKMLSAIHAKEDLNQMVELVKEVHYNPFFLSDSSSFNNVHKYFLNYLGKNDSISIEEFTIVNMHLLASINDAHTSINVTSSPLIPGLLANDFFNLKVEFTENEKILVVAGADSGKAIESINGQMTIQLYNKSISCYGGKFNFKREIVQNSFFPIFLHLENIHSPYTVKYTDGSSTIVQKGFGIKEFLSSAGNSKPDYVFKTVKGNIGCIEYNRCNDARKFATFLENTFKEIHDKGINQLIIDIRQNTGGNSSLNDLLLNYVTKIPYRQSGTRYWRVSETFKEKIDDRQYKNLWGKRFVKQYKQAETGSVLKEDQYGLTIPKQPNNYFNGEVCLLIGPKTFSSANFLADAAATYSLFPLIGKPTGENTNDFGEQINLSLNHSQLELQVSIAYDIGADGDVNRIETVDPTMYSVGDARDFAIDWFLNKE